jgi:hypothetical protein
LAGPSDASELVGKGDGGLVVAAETLDLQRPGAKSVGVLFGLGSPEYGARSVREEHAEVRVASLADATEPSDLTAGALLRYEAEVARESPSGAESTEVADESDDGGGGEKADAKW